MKKSTVAEQITMKLEDIVTYISPDDLLPNPYQPKSRAVTSPEEAKAGWLSLERSGLIHFPVVRRAKAKDKYEVGDGWQRRNWYLYGYYEQKDDKYARVPCVVKELDDRQMADLILDANAERKDLNDIEWGEFFKKYAEDFKVTQEEMGRRFRRSQGEIANTMRLLELPAEIQARIISHEITPSHGRELLRLNKQPERQQKLVADIVKNKIPVSELSRRIESEIYNGSKSLDHKHWDNPPRFDIKGCEGCEHVEKLAAYSGAPNNPRFLDPECWNKKQKEATAAKDAAVLEKLRELGIDKIYGEGDKHGQFYSLYLDFLARNPDCTKCPKRAAVKNNWNNEYSILCTDTKCFDGKREQEQIASQAESRQKRESFERRIEAAVENCDDENVHMQGIILLLADYFDESLPGWFGINNEPKDGEDEHEMDIGAALQKALDNLNPHDMAKKLLRGLLLENYSNNAEDVLEKIEGESGQTVESEIESLKPAADAELIAIEPLVASPAEPVKDLPCNDCLNNETCDRSFFTTDGQGGYKCERKAGHLFDGLEIHIAAEGEKFHHFKLGDCEASFESLKDCVVSMAHQVGLTQSPDHGEILTALKALPATRDTALLIGIMESGQVPEVPAEPPPARKFTKSVRCGMCNEQKRMEFILDKEDATAEHWKGECPKCGAINYIKNARWDGMVGIKSGGEEAEE